MRRLRPEDLEPTERERALTRRLQDGEKGAGMGAGIGTALGAGLGALGFLAGPEVGLPAMGLGASLGGSLGGAIGGSAGGMSTDAAADELQKAEAKRQQLLNEYQLRQQALDALMQGHG